MIMTATDELRAMLDERGVEWWKGEDKATENTITYFREEGSNFVWTAIEAPEGNLWLYAANLKRSTPAQAIEATLGRGTCRIDTEESPFLNIQRWHICGECGTGFSLWYYSESGDECEETPNFCPRCGSQVDE